jgi:hypothetical protein
MKVLIKIMVVSFFCSIVGQHRILHGAPMQESFLNRGKNVAKQINQLASKISSCDDLDELRDAIERTTTWLETHIEKNTAAEKDFLTLSFPEHLSARRGLAKINAALSQLSSAVENIATRYDTLTISSEFGKLQNTARNLFKLYHPNQQTLSESNADITGLLKQVQKKFSAIETIASTPKKKPVIEFPIHRQEKQIAPDDDTVVISDFSTPKKASKNSWDRFLKRMNAAIAPRYSESMPLNEFLSSSKDQIQTQITQLNGEKLTIPADYDFAKEKKVFDTFIEKLNGYELHDLKSCNLVSNWVIEWVGLVRTAFEEGNMQIANFTDDIKQLIENYLAKIKDDIKQRDEGEGINITEMKQSGLLSNE